VAHTPYTNGESWDAYNLRKKFTEIRERSPSVNLRSSDNMLELALMQDTARGLETPEIRHLMRQEDYEAAGRPVAPNLYKYDRKFFGAQDPARYRTTAGLHYGVGSTLQPKGHFTEIRMGADDPEEEIIIHEVAGHEALDYFRQKQGLWDDLTFVDPTDNQEKLVIDFLMPADPDTGRRNWDRGVAHDIVQTDDPSPSERGEVGYAREGYLTSYPQRGNDGNWIWMGAIRAMKVALNERAGEFVARPQAVPAAPELDSTITTILPSPQEEGLLSDKMSNEAWVQRVMGKGAEEERKTEVSKQKVEAKRQAQVAEVKKEKEAEKKPSTVREAKAQGSLYFWDSKGNKKLALTAEDVKKFKASDKYDPEGKSTLTQMANIGKKEGIEGLLTTAPEKPRDVEVPKAEKKKYNFRKNWEKYYYAGKPYDKDYMADWEIRLSSKKALPQAAKDAIEIAVDIFGGDKDKNKKRYSADRLRKDLQNIGRVESQYGEKESTGGGKEKGWWQVKPSTAKDALKNAKKLFGEKFNKHFEKYGGYDGLWDRAQKGTLSDLMLKDEQLAAAFAAVQVIRTFDQE
jgi:hypothetical protein